MPGVEKQDLRLEEVKEVIEKAHRKGMEAAAAKYEEMCGKDPRRGGLRGLCGGSNIRIGLDGRSRLAHQLKMASQQNDHFSFCARGKIGRKYLDFAFRHGRQEQEVDEAGSEAALAVLKRELGVAGYVEWYYT